VHRIEPHPLWIGHAGDGRDVSGLFAHEIRAVVQLAREDPPLVLPRELILLRIPIVDGAGNDPALMRLAVSSVASLIAAGVPTLVCCGAGMSRSPAIAAAALSCTESSEPEVCLTRVTRGYPADVSPALWTDLLSALADR
jgi:protein-tyrosine phosphatase